MTSDKKEAELRRAQAAVGMRQSTTSQPPPQPLKPIPNSSNERGETVTVQSDDMPSILEQYRKRKKLLDGVTDNPNYKEPEEYSVGNKNAVKLFFSTPEEATNFCTDLAKENKKFIVCDANKNVVAYSNGDGSLYHPDGVVYQKGETVSSRPSSVKREDFEIPSSSSPRP